MLKRNRGKRNISKILSTFLIITGLLLTLLPITAFADSDPVYEGLTAFKIDKSGGKFVSGTYTDGALTVNVTFGPEGAGEITEVSFTSNIPVMIAYLKGGTGGGGEPYNYSPGGTTSASGLRTQKNKNGQYQGLSHLTLYYNPNYTPPEDPTGSITIKKNVLQGDEDIEDDTPFELKVYEGEYEAEKDPVWTGSIAEGSDAVITGLALGAYTIVETVPTGYSNNNYIQYVTLSKNNLTATVTMTNIKDSEPPEDPTGSITIKKNVLQGDEDIEDDTPFELKVYEGEYEAEKDPVWTGSIAEGSDAVITGLALGAYTIVETVPGGYTNANNKQCVTLDAENLTAIVTMENIKDPEQSGDPVGKIIIKKDVDNVTNDPTEFTVNVYEIKEMPQAFLSSLEAQVNVQQVSEGEKELYWSGKVKEGSPVTLQDVPLGKYIVEEEGKSGYIKVSIDPDEPFIINDNGDEVTVKIVNRKKTTPVNPPYEPPVTPPTDPPVTPPEEAGPEPEIEEFDEEPIPAGPSEKPAEPEPEPVVVLDEPAPAAPPALPKTGGIPSGIFYGLGALFAGSGVFMRLKKRGK